MAYRAETIDRCVKRRSVPICRDVDKEVDEVVETRATLFVYPDIGIYVNGDLFAAPE